MADQRSAASTDEAMQESENFRRRDLPHWDLPGAYYFITSCLDGSLPAQGLVDLRKFEKRLQETAPPSGATPAEWERECWKKAFVRRERWLDQRPAVRHLQEPALAAIVQNSLLHFAGDRYDVLGYVVMPSHFHWVFRPREEWVKSLEGERSPRQRIMQNLKSYSASQCNRHRQTEGRFWQEESYDRCPFDVDELERILSYIEYNPVRAGLVARPEDWPYSSARIRHERGLLLGAPILKSAP
jgi:type I restriction enzyme R subunit